MLSATAMEDLRRLMEEAGAAADLIRQSDLDMLRAIGGVSEAGELLGRQQSGAPPLRFGDLAEDADLVDRARALGKAHPG